MSTKENNHGITHHLNATNFKNLEAHRNINHEATTLKMKIDQKLHIFDINVV
jgi:hypothetical protein